MNTCTWRAPMVTLHDGRQVRSDSEEWRHESEAMAVIAMRGLAERRAYLHGKIDMHGNISGGVLQKRGQAATERLERTIKQIWFSKR